MGKPSAAALKLALTDKDAVRRPDVQGFSANPNHEHLPRNFITSIEVKDARKMGRGRSAQLRLSPWLNAVIGGRGTGKSTWVHCLRLAYGREKDLEHLATGDEVQENFDSFNQVTSDKTKPGGLTATTQIVVGLVRQGDPHDLQWRKQGKQSDAERTVSRDGKPTEDQAVSPISIYSQGQIATLARDRRGALLRLIDEAADTASLGGAVTESANQVAATRACIRVLDSRLEGEAATKRRHADVLVELKRLEDENESPLRKQYERVMAQQQAVTRHHEHSVQLVNSLNQLASCCSLAQLDETLFEEETEGRLQVISSATNLVARVDEAKSRIGECKTSGDSKEWVPVQQASAGQRSAAMLALLLAQGSEPLVLDQPEDDLDNHLIYSLIVAQLRANQVRRQIFVVTHNPNIVVNGDAECVYAMKFAAGQCCVDLSGCLEEARTRDEVCQVMEGGRQAFQRRYDRLAGGG